MGSHTREATRGLEKRHVGRRLHNAREADIYCASSRSGSDHHFLEIASHDAQRSDSRRLIRDFLAMAETSRTFAGDLRARVHHSVAVSPRPASHEYEYAFAVAAGATGSSRPLPDFTHVEFGDRNWSFDVPRMSTSQMRPLTMLGRILSIGGRGRARWSGRYESWS